MSGCCDVRGGAQVGFPREDAGRRTWPKNQPAGGKSLWAEEVLSKQRNAAWSPGDGGGEEGGGGAAVAARLPASPPASPGEPSPPLSARAAAAPGKWEEAALRGCFPVHFCRPGWGRKVPTPLPRVDAAHASLSVTHVRSVTAGLGVQAGRGVRKCTERSEPTRQLGGTRSKRAAAAPPSRSLIPERSWRTRTGLHRSRSRAAETPLQVWGVTIRGGEYTRTVDLANTPLHLPQGPNQG
ncbi:uncharacterized protein [Saccopteryx leptura]|uniref:uncharacterized protein n=1 Tax=Saccopteryx leptura TaxID=249018 RepID=UPI00339C6ED7